MFRLDLSPNYFYPVKLQVLDGDGKLHTQVFDARFKRLSQAQVEAMQAQGAAGALTDQKVLDDVLCGWRGLQDADGNDLAFTPENVAKVIGVAGLRVAMVRSFFDSQSPTESAALAAKN